MQYNTISTNYILLHGIIRLGFDPNPSRRHFRTARPQGEIDLRRGQRHYWCLTTDSLPRGSPGQYVRASAYAELDGKRKRQSIYPGSDHRSMIE